METRGPTPAVLTTLGLIWFVTEVSNTNTNTKNGRFTAAVSIGLWLDSERVTGTKS